MYQKKGEPNVWYPDDDDDFEEEQPIRTRISRKGVGIVEIDYYEDETVWWCPHCKAAGFKVRLGPKILMPGEKRPPDYDQWLQCTDCYEVVAAHVIEHDATIIRDDIETVESPFENQTVIEYIPKRTSPAGKRLVAKRRKERDRPHHKDKEIDMEMQRHGDRVKVLQDSDP